MRTKDAREQMRDRAAAGMSLRDREPFDEAAEYAVIGALTLTPQLIPAVVADVGLRPEHFWWSRCRRVFDVIVSLHDNGEPVDTVTVAAEAAVRHPDTPAHEWRDWVAVRMEHIPGAISNVTAWAKRVVDCADLRRYRDAGSDLLEASGSENWEAIRVIESDLLYGGPPPANSYSAEDLGHMLFGYLEGDSREVWATPWPKMNQILNGGLRRGAATVVSGFTKHGKSIVVDQMLEHAARNGLRAHLYLNEMAPQERALRTVARLTNVPFSNLQNGKLSLEDNRRVLDVLGKLPFGMTDISGWTAVEIARDIRRRKWDIACVDIFGKIAGGQLTTDLDEKTRVLTDIPKPSQGNCHLLITAHVRKGKTTGPVRDKPTEDDLRGTGSLANDSDNVIFIHRDQEKSTGRKLDTGLLYSPTVRNGHEGGLKVELENMGFREQPPAPTPASAAKSDADLAAF